MDSMEAAIAAGVGAPPSTPGAKRPQLPNNLFKFPAPARLKAIQHYINSFEYKQTPTTSFNSHKFRPLSRIMDTAKMMIYSPQPIKCVEAVFLALYLTAGMQDVDRIPLSFKTQEEKKIHQHIVLLVRYGDKYGAFGISRRTDLMNKEFEFESISSIVDNFKRAYENHMHTVLKIRIGLPVEHNVESYNFICWRFLTVTPACQQWSECCEEMEKHAQHAKKLWEKWLIEGQGGAAKTSAFRQSLKTREEEMRTKTSSTTTTTKQVTVATCNTTSRRPVSRMRTQRPARVEGSETGSKMVVQSKKEGKQLSCRERRRCRKSRPLLVVARPNRNKSTATKFALKGCTIELRLEGDVCERGGVKERNVPCKCSLKLSLFK